jgi:hypothetical protein
MRCPSYDWLSNDLAKPTVCYVYGAPHPRQALRDLDTPHDIRSTLNVDAALAALGQYEALVHATAGLVLTNVPPIVDSFLAFCWYLSDVADVLNQDDRREKVINGVRDTLARHQLPPQIQARWSAGAVATVGRPTGLPLQAPPLRRD